MIEIWANNLKSGYTYLKYSILEKYPFFEKILQTKLHINAEIYERIYDQLKLFKHWLVANLIQKTKDLDIEAVWMVSELLLKFLEV